ncbi:hypothetical protein KC354_g114 [Hortaea werneckii]|nr:hypothetical protein KC354_g114 [Hortaea werneckii]
MHPVRGRRISKLTTDVLPPDIIGRRYMLQILQGIPSTSEALLPPFSPADPTMKQSQLSAPSAVKPTKTQEHYPFWPRQALDPEPLSWLTSPHPRHQALHLPSRSPCKQNVERVLAPSSYQQSTHRRK